jgi:hypothetical protein
MAVMYASKETDNTFKDETSGMVDVIEHSSTAAATAAPQAENQADIENRLSRASLIAALSFAKVVDQLKSAASADEVRKIAERTVQAAVKAAQDVIKLAQAREREFLQINDDDEAPYIGAPGGAIRKALPPRKNKH